MKRLSLVSVVEHESKAERGRTLYGCSRCACSWFVPHLAQRHMEDVRLISHCPPVRKRSRMDYHIRREGAAVSTGEEEISAPPVLKRQRSSSLLNPKRSEHIPPRLNTDDSLLFRDAQHIARHTFKPVESESILDLLGLGALPLNSAWNCVNRFSEHISGPDPNVADFILEAQRHSAGSYRYDLFDAQRRIVLTAHGLSALYASFRECNTALLVEWQRLHVPLTPLFNSFKSAHDALVSLTPKHQASVGALFWGPWKRACEEVMTAGELLQMQQLASTNVDTWLTLAFHSVRLFCVIGNGYVDLDVHLSNFAIAASTNRHYKEAALAILGEGELAYENDERHYVECSLCSKVNVFAEDDVCLACAYSLVGSETMLKDVGLTRFPYDQEPSLERWFQFLREHAGEFYSNQ